MGSSRSPFRDFEKYLGIVARMDEDDPPVPLIQYNSISITHEILPGLYLI